MKSRIIFFSLCLPMWIQSHYVSETYAKSLILRQEIKSEDIDSVRNILTEVNGREVFISYPADLPQSSAYPVVMAIHGNGREARSYMPGDEKSVDFYIHQRDLAVKNGFMFVVLSNGIDTWGTDKGLRNLEHLYDFIKTNYRVKKEWALWATSAGGTLMNRLIREYPEIVSRAMGTFPVYDLKDSMERSNGAKKVWSDKIQKLQTINPSEFPGALTKVPILIFHGSSDKVVPPEFHSQWLQKEVNSRGGDVTLYLVDGGHSTKNWNVYDDRILTDFLKQ